MSGILILVIYTVLMLAVTLILTRKNKSTESFYVGNRKIGTLSSAMSQRNRRILMDLLGYFGF